VLCVTLLVTSSLAVFEAAILILTKLIVIELGEVKILYRVHGPKIEPLVRMIIKSY